MDKHLNLYFTYKTHHLEDNVTRALLVTLQQLSPSHLRLLLRELLTDTSIFDRLSGTEYLLDASTPVEFDLQVSPWDEDSGLGRDEGVILGIEYSATQEIRFDPEHADDRHGRPDAVIKDEANGFWVIIESKLGDDLYREQIERHHATFFDTEAVQHAKDVFVTTTWDSICKWLELIQDTTKDAKEGFIIGQFVEYVDMLGLLEFRPFRNHDFDDRRGDKLDKFLFVFSGKVQEAMGLTEYQGDGQFWFENVPHENIYWDIDVDGITGYVLYGCGKKWRASQFKQLITSNRRGFQELVQSLRASLDDKIDLFLQANARFHLNRVQIDHLYALDGRHIYPDGFNAFCDIVTNPMLNSLERLDQGQIRERFAEYMIETGADDEPKHRFLAWEQPVLQYCYCDVGFRIPRAALVKKQRGDLVDLFGGALTYIKTFMQEMERLIEES